MTERLRELSADSRALLEAGRAPEAIPAEVKARLWGQISSAMLAPSSVQVPHAPRLAPAVPATSAGGKTLLGLKLACAALALAGAGALLVLAVGRLHRSPGAPPRVDAPSLPSRAIPPARTPVPSIEAPSRDQPLEPVKAPKPATILRAHSQSQAPPLVIAPSPAGEDLAAERSLIVRAQRALQRGDPLDALAALRTHEEQFRAGSLAEERDALRIEALQASGDRAAAEMAAAQFARTYPNGLLAPAVRATLREKP